MPAQLAHGLGSSVGIVLHDGGATRGRIGNDNSIERWRRSETEPCDRSLSWRHKPSISIMLQKLPSMLLTHGQLQRMLARPSHPWGCPACHEARGPRSVAVASSFLAAHFVSLRAELGRTKLRLARDHSSDLKTDDESTIPTRY
ncbi:hypothetical protein RJ55_04568 [Drechmeria coniospora]|nr:hypothetical protein RJ55_04568 [Drechmeria coniospora]